MRYWTASRSLRVSAALLLGLVASAAFLALSGSLPRFSLTTGDLPGFYVAAEILQNHSASELYNFTLQQEIQARLFPEMEGSFYIFAYPPFTAALLQPLALLSPDAAKIVFDGVQAAALILTFIILRPFLPENREYRLSICLLTICFMPVFTAVTSAQNTAFSMLLLSLVLRSLLLPSRVSNLIAGAAAGVWLYKPQYALFCLPLFLIYRRWDSLASFGVVALAWHALSSHLIGTDWLPRWLEATQQFGLLNYERNGFNMVSLNGTIASLNSWAGNEAGSLLYLSSFLSVLLFLTYLFFLWRSPTPYRLALFGWITVTVSPQTLFYDLGIALPGLLLLSARHPRAASLFLFFLTLASLITGFLRLETELPLFGLLSLSAPLILFSGKMTQRTR